MISEPDSTLAGLDRERLQRQCGNDSQLVKLICESYRNDSELLLESLSAALEANDRENLSLHAHSLKGLAAYLCADRLLHHAKWLDQNAETEEPGVLAQSVARIRAEHDALLSLLDQL